MAITIPDLPAADFNKELRLALATKDGPIAWNLVDIVDLEELSKIPDPVILLRDIHGGRTCKAGLGLLIEYLECTAEVKLKEANELIEIIGNELYEAVAILTALVDEPEGKRPIITGHIANVIKKFLESTK